MTLKSISGIEEIEALLGDEAAYLLEHRCETVPAEQIYVPAPDMVDAVWEKTDRSPRVQTAIGRLLRHGRLGGTGYVSILPFDQAVEHGAGLMYAAAPWLFDPKAVMELAVEGGCSGIATTYGLLGTIARKYAHRIPLILKINHNEQLTYPRTFDHVMFARVEDACEMGCAGISATVFWGSVEATRQLQEVSEVFAHAHSLGMFTILHCYLWNDAFTVDGVNHHFSADLSAQANHLGATIEADFIKQKQATHNGGYPAMNRNGTSFGKYDPAMYDALATDHPIDLTRYQVVNGYSGKIPLINSGGESGENDLQQAVRTAVINKRAGGMGLLCGRKAFQRPVADGVRLLHAIQDVYLCPEVTVA